MLRLQARLAVAAWAIFGASIASMMASSQLRAEDGGKKPGGGHALVGGMMGGPAIMPMLLLRSPKVQGELGLSEEQKAKLKELAANYFREIRQQGGGLRELGEQQRMEELARVHKTVHAQGRGLCKKIDEVFSSQQRERFKQILWQVRGVTALGDKEVAEALGLTDQQKRTLEEMKPIYAELTDALKKLRDDVIELSRARRAVAVMVNTVGKDAPLKALESCGVKSGDIVTGLTIDPAGPFEVAKSSTVGFVAKGGMSPYSATVKGPSDGVIVTQPAPFSPAFNVTASKEAQAGTYVVNVFDGSGQIKRVEIVVKDGDRPATVSSGTETLSSSRTSVIFATFKDEVKGLSIEISGTGVKLKIGEPELQQDKVTVPATVDSVEKPKLNLSAFNEEAVKKALMGKSASGITVNQVAIKDFPTLMRAVEEKAKAQPGQ